MLGEEGGGDDPLAADDGLLDEGLLDEGLLGDDLEVGGDAETGDDPDAAAASRGGKSEKKGLWVIDPIDGTANFLRGMPYWSVALADPVDGRTEIGVTYDPVHDDLFWARRGTGAYRNERRVRVLELRRSRHRQCSVSLPSTSR